MQFRPKAPAKGGSWAAQPQPLRQPRDKNCSKFRALLAPDPPHPIHHLLAPA